MPRVRFSKFVRHLNLLTCLVFVSACFVLFATSATAQTFTTLATFDASGGYWVQYTSLVQGRDGNIYGTSTTGGQWGSNGIIFKLAPDGQFSTIYNFCNQDSCSDGDTPMGGLIQASDGNFYGTTFSGGAYQNGTVFRLTPAGKLTTLYSFCAEGNHCPSGANPSAALVQADDGNFYGTTVYGGTNLLRCGDAGCGTIFKITPQGEFRNLYAFWAQSSTCIDGSQPSSALVQNVDGNLYGTAEFGGIGDRGTLFKISPAGKFETVYKFCGSDGWVSCSAGGNPYAGLILGSDGRLYGVAAGGGVFSITDAGKFSNLYSFCSSRGCPNGYAPFMALDQGSDGNFYGSTAWGAEGQGTLFEITPAGSLKTLYALSSGEVNSALLQATNGKFYGGTLQGGGPGATGSVFSLDVALGPFVALERSWGKVGQAGGILGQGFAGTTSVALNGTPASFTVVSDTYLTATVPADATSGYVTVSTPSGTLTSNVPFHVMP